MNDKKIRSWKKAVHACFKVLFCHLTEVHEYNYEDTQSRQLAARLEVRIIQA